MSLIQIYDKNEVIPQRIYNDEMARENIEKNTVRKIHDTVISIIRASKGKKFSIEIKEKWEPFMRDKDDEECDYLMIFNATIILIELTDDKKEEVIIK